MRRRNLLRGTAVAATVSVAGCAGRLEEIAGSVDGDDRKVGESASHNGVKATPDKYVLADKAKRVFPNSRKQMNAPEGATYLFTHLAVSHEGDSAQEFPGILTKDNINLIYDGESVDDGGLRADSTRAYIVDGKTLKTYQRALNEADALGEVYPGKKVDGWLFHKVAENFDPAKLKFRITWNPQVMGDDGETVHKWTYTSDAEVAIEDVEGDGGIVVLGRGLVSASR